MALRPIASRPHLLLVPTKVRNWRKLLDCSIGSLIFFDLWYLAKPFPEGQQFVKFRDLLWKHGRDEVQELVNKEVHDCYVAVVPSLFWTLVLVISKDGLDLAGPHLH